MWIELLSVAAAENLKRSPIVLLEVERPLRMLVTEPVRGDEIGDEDIADFVPRPWRNASYGAGDA